MADPLYRLNPARAFPSEIEDMVRHVATARNKFLKNNPLGLNPVRTTIHESWQRCAALIEPGRDRVPIVIESDAQLRDLKLTNEPFLRAASSVVDRLTQTLAGSGYIIGLADAQGCLLQVSGDEAAIRWMEQFGLAPGGDWSEANAGTNGIGTALAVGHAVHVVGPEHYCEGWQDISCITVPIRDPWKGNIAGILDVSGDYHLVRPFFTGILAAAALEIKENLKLMLPPRLEIPSPFRVTVPSFPRRREKTPARATKQSAWVNRMAPSLRSGLRAQVRFHERRAFAAERLAIATGTISANLDFDSALSEIAKQSAQLLGVEGAAVCLLEDEGSLNCVRAWSKPAALTWDLPGAVSELLEQSEVVALLRENSEPLAIDDVRNSTISTVRGLDRRGVHSLALLPLQGAHSVKGLLVLTRPVPYRWQPDDLRLELALAFHAATAIENTHLFETLRQHQHRLEALNAVNQLLHSLYDPAQQLGLIIERIVEIMEMDGGLISLNRGPNNEPYLAAYAGFEEPILTDLYEAACEYSVCRAASFICCTKPERSNFSQELRNKLREMQLCDAMLVPLAAGSDVLGFLLVSSSYHSHLIDEDLTLFTNIGQQLGLALRNAQLLRSAGEMQALREADRIKNRFLIMVSHDLRSPLTAIRTSVESLLDREGEQSAETHEHLLRNIAGQAKRLGRLVDRLLDLSRIEAGALTLDRDWTELGALISDSVAKFERLNEACNIRQEIAADLPLVYVDPERIVQVLWNLLENAYKYSPANSLITVEAFLSGPEVLIRVLDRGKGIPEKEHEKIFQYFYRLLREQKLHTPGSGLGLAICRGIIDAHCGRIWVEDRPGGGSIFTVALPPSLIDSGSLVSLEELDTIGSIRN